MCVFTCVLVHVSLFVRECMCVRACMRDWERYYITEYNIHYYTLSICAYVIA